MATKDPGPFAHVPRNAGGHFVICLYAAIYRLLFQVYRLGEIGGASLEEVFERFPFLGEYFNEMRSHLPEEISWQDGTGWWQEQIQAWESGCDEHLPLRALSDQAELDFTSRLAFMVTGLVEEDSRFGTLFAELQEPLAQRRPTLELAGQMMMDEVAVGEIDPWSICRPMLDLGLVEAPNRESARSEWVLKVPPLLWDAVRGQIEPRPMPGYRFKPYASLISREELIVLPELKSKIEKIPDLINNRITRMIVVRGLQGANCGDLMAAIAHQLGLGVIEIDQHNAGREVAARLTAPLAIVANSMPVFNFDLGPGETAELPPMPGYSGPIGICLGFEGGLSSDIADRAITLNLQTPGIELRKLYWEKAFNGHAVADLATITERFRLPGTYIQQAAHMALAQAGLQGRECVAIEDVRSASRSLNRQMLDTLASHLEANGSWSDLIAGDATSEKLQELFRRCRYREELIDHLGPAFGNTSNCGVRALFTGASGTGKTLAAKILAAELGMDLYRVDLAAIVNKYIGETEKNLHRVLSRAEALDVVLLLDEGDALLGSRTEVKSANDRYANLETNYLLQRLEHYQGIVLITTNLMQNIDRAFQRRMDVLVPFASPQAEERLSILKLHLPDDQRVDAQLLETAALRCALNGGQIRNAALHATLFALDDNSPVRWEHLQEGLRSEYKKAGGTFPLDGLMNQQERDNGMQMFLGALNES